MRLIIVSISLLLSSTALAQTRQAPQELAPDRARDAEAEAEAEADRQSERLGCEAFYDERAGEWRCEDDCLEASDGRYCGQTDHF